MYSWDQPGPIADSELTRVEAKYKDLQTQLKAVESELQELRQQQVGDNCATNTHPETRNVPVRDVKCHSDDASKLAGDVVSYLMKRGPGPIDSLAGAGIGQRYNWIFHNGKKNTGSFKGWVDSLAGVAVKKDEASGHWYVALKGDLAASAASNMMPLNTASAAANMSRLNTAVQVYAKRPLNKGDIRIELKKSANTCQALVHIEALPKKHTCISGPVSIDEQTARSLVVGLACDVLDALNSEVERSLDKPLKKTGSHSKTQPMAKGVAAASARSPVSCKTPDSRPVTPFDLLKRSLRQYVQRDLTEREIQIATRKAPDGEGFEALLQIAALPSEFRAIRGPLRSDEHSARGAVIDSGVQVLELLLQTLSSTAGELSQTCRVEDSQESAHSRPQNEDLWHSSTWQNSTSTWWENHACEAWWSDKGQQNTDDKGTPADISDAIEPISWPSWAEAEAHIIPSSAHKVPKV